MAIPTIPTAWFVVELSNLCISSILCFLLFASCNSCHLARSSPRICVTPKCRWVQACACVTDSCCARLSKRCPSGTCFVRNENMGPGQGRQIFNRMSRASSNELEPQTSSVAARVMLSNGSRILRCHTMLEIVISELTAAQNDAAILGRP